MTEPVQAVLWDMDGLVVDTEPLWTIAETELAVHLGGQFTPQAKAAMVGTRLDTAVPILFESLGLVPEPEQVGEAMSWLLHRMAALFTAPLALLPGTARLLADLRAHGVPIALVSSSYRLLVDAVLAHGVGPFEVTLAGDEVGRAKPDPEPYLSAAAALGADPSQCVVLEDSPAGIESGTRAGCAVVAVPSVPGVVVPAARRRLVVPSLAGVRVEQLAELVRATSTAVR